MLGLGTHYRGFMVDYDLDPCFGEFVRDYRRIYETIGCKPHFTKFIVWRNALENSVMSFTLKLVSGKLGLGANLVGFYYVSF